MVNVEVELPRSLDAPGLAWHALIKSLCADYPHADLLIDAELLISELAANAFMHGQRHITLRARLDEDRLLVEIVDEGFGFELKPRRPDIEQIGGRGLDIAADLGGRWGVYEGTTHVWFELERSSDRKSACGNDKR